jgi:hypothetical protein
MADVATIISRLGGQTQVGVICGFERNHGARGHDFKMRNCIPRRYWSRILAYASEKNIPDVTLEVLERAHPASRPAETEAA